MTSKLATLRSRLAGLRRRRAALRFGTGWSGFVLAALAVIVAAFLVDWLFHASVPQRLVLWGLGLVAVGWAWWRYTRPYLGWAESDEEMALLVERQQGIDSDLVAAMQFESHRATTWGSPQLETAVVDYVADFSPNLDVYEGLDTHTFRRRFLLLATVAALLVAAVLLFPQYATAFGNRMLLGRAHYPTATRIDSIAINGKPVWPVSPDDLVEREQRRDRAVLALETATARLAELHTAARTESQTSEGLLDAWFGPDTPIANAARTVTELRSDEHGLAADVRALDTGHFDDLARVLAEQRRIAVTLDQLAGREILGTVAAPLDTARSAAHAATAAVGRLVPSLPYGEELEVRVQLAGDLPTSARTVLTSLDGNVRTELTLDRESITTTADANADSDDSKPVAFIGRLPRMLDSVVYAIHAGDASTDPAVIAVVPLPAVTVEIRATPPDYAADEIAPALPGQLQQSVVEGSRVELLVQCSNKPLESAVVTIGDDAFPLRTADDDGRRWSLDVAGTPFAEVRDTLRFEVRATDADGLELENPIQGYLRIKPDRLPRIRANIKYGLPIALPNATPAIEYRASDDFGLARIAATIEIEHEDGRTSTDTRLLRRIAPADQPTREIAGDYTLDFAPLGLVRGDELKITFEAVDHRGTLEPGTGLSEPLAFRVAGEADVLREMQKLDARAERDLDAIIRRELGIGETP